MTESDDALRVAREEIKRQAAEIEYLKAYSTEYVVVSRAIIVQGIDYFEKFELATTGLNDSFSDVADEATGPLYTDNSFLDGGL